MLTSNEAAEAVQSLSYAYWKDREGNQRYHEQVAEIEAQWKAWLHKEHGYNLTEGAHQAVLAYAWEQGHAYGYQEVENHYIDLVRLVEQVCGAGTCFC